MDSPPDKSFEREELAKAQSFMEAISEIADIYDVPLTGNEARWQDGKYLWEFEDFYADVYAAAEKFPTDRCWCRTPVIENTDLIMDEEERKENERD